MVLREKPQNLDVLIVQLGNVRDGAAIGGSLQTIRRLIDAWVENGYAIGFLAADAALKGLPLSVRYSTSAGFSGRSKPSQSMSVRQIAGWSLRELLALPRAIPSEPPRVVLVNNLDLFNMLALKYLRLKWRNTYFVVFIHHLESGLSQSNSKALSKTSILAHLVRLQTVLSLRLLRNSADLVMTNSPIVGSLTHEMRHSNLQLPVVGVDCGVDIKAINLAPADPRERQVLFVGGLRTAKGSYVLADAMRQVCDHVGEICLTIVGRHSLEAKSEFVARLPKDVRTEFLEDLDDQQVYGAMKSSFVLCAPSLEEGWSLTIDEAVACGMRVIAFDLPAYERYRGHARVEMVPVEMGSFGIGQALIHHLSTDARENHAEGPPSSYPMDISTVASQYIHFLSRYLDANED